VAPLAPWPAYGLGSTSRIPQCSTFARSIRSDSRAHDRPQATATNVTVGKAEQLLVARGVGADRGLGEHPAEVGDGGGGAQSSLLPASWQLPGPDSHRLANTGLRVGPSFLTSSPYPAPHAAGHTNVD